MTHFFESHLAGYRGWRWAVTVTRVPRSRHVTVCETVLLPGPDAMLAPGWLPWNERLQPGDLGVGDLMPTAPDDDRLAPGLRAQRRPRGRGGLLGARPRPVPGDVPRGPDRDRPALVRRRRRPGGADLDRRPAQRPLRHLRLLPAAGRRRCGRCSASAATSTPPTTAGRSAPTTAAARTPRRCWAPPSSRSRSCRRSTTTARSRRSRSAAATARSRPASRPSLRPQLGSGLGHLELGVRSAPGGGAGCASWRIIVSRPGMPHQETGHADPRASRPARRPASSDHRRPPRTRPARPARTAPSADRAARGAAWCPSPRPGPCEGCACGAGDRSATTIRLRPR